MLTTNYDANDTHVGEGVLVDLPYVGAFEDDF